jgi:hypothetical protein
MSDSFCRLDLRWRKSLTGLGKSDDKEAYQFSHRRFLTAFAEKIIDPERLVYRRQASWLC